MTKFKNTPEFKNAPGEGGVERERAAAGRAVAAAAGHALQYLEHPQVPVGPLSQPPASRLRPPPLGVRVAPIPRSAAEPRPPCVSLV